MFLKLTNVAAVLLIGTALTGCSTTSRTSSVSTSTYYTPAYRPAPHTTIITKTKAYQGYKPKYAQAPLQSIHVHQNQMIKNKVVHNKVVQNSAPYAHTHPYVNPHTHRPQQSYTSTKPSTSAYKSYDSNAPYTSFEHNQINAAKQRSLETKAQEDAWNNRLDAADEHQMQQALMNSYETKAAEDAARGESSWLDSSAHTQAPSPYDGAPASQNVYRSDTKVPDESAPWVDDSRQLQQAMDASLQTQAAEDSARQQALAMEETRQLQQAMDASLQTQASVEQPVVQAAIEQPVAQPVAWVPNEGVQVQAGEKLMELKRNNGGVSPSHADMKVHLQREMNLSESESGTVLDELGIE
ncbi:MAG: hypothetical protein K2X53_05585 [Alphaproteobacteria bacterium]|nr:hypothetical protein [Alphaproteobacteria bacterium]